MRTLTLTLILLAACGGEEAQDSAVPPADDTSVTLDSGEPHRDEGCEEVSIKVIGEEPPALGDSWTVYLNCDEAVMTGTTVVRVDPPDFASIADNVITWTTVGSAVLTVQVGSIRLTEDVTVGEEG